MARVRLIIVAILFLSAIFYDTGYAQMEHRVYFEGTSYELHVYEIKGRKPGNTMLIIGGIQGDEPGGFLSADLYIDLNLEQGNLIVVPRANFKSIMLFNRGVDGDMNRIFDRENGSSMMFKVVAIIKNLMKKADVFLNLHDGYGFYRPRYIDELRNPRRFGQSVIIDTDVFRCKDGRVLQLKSLAERVIEEVNKKIERPEHRMHLMNTKTNAPDTPYPAMKKTATFYALTEECLPSFGVESSKNIQDLELRVLYHNYVINAFMKEFQIIPEQPRVILVKPKLEYAVININGSPTIVSPGETIYLAPDSEVMVTHIESNYERGLSCDILGIGEINDFRRPYRIKNDTKIIFRKDYHKIGTVSLKINRDFASLNWIFVVKVNGRYKPVFAGDTLIVKEGDEIELLYALSASTLRDLPINFKGFVPSNREVNTGDDRNIKIKIRRDLLIDKFSRQGKGVEYPVVLEGFEGDRSPKFWIRISH